MREEFTITTQTRTLKIQFILRQFMSCRCSVLTVLTAFNSESDITQLYSTNYRTFHFKCKAFVAGACPTWNAYTPRITSIIHHAACENEWAMEVRIRQSYDDTHSVLKAAKNSTEQEIFFRSALYLAFQFKMSSMVFIIIMFSLMYYYHYHVFVTLEGVGPPPRSLPCLHSNPEQTNQTLILERDFFLFF